MMMEKITIMEKLKNKVLLGLSGGVDSTAAVLMLKKKGFDVTGYYFDVSGNNAEGLAKAKLAASQLGIELMSESVKSEFEETVISNFCSEYSCGRTPNPCIICNPMIKFKKLIEAADKIGAYYIATGHYARVKEIDGKHYIQMGVNQKKDQSYMLYRLPEGIISRLILPLGDVDDKAKIRDLARSENLSNADDSDSQEICFIDDSFSGYEEFLRKRGFKSVEGNFVDKTGKVLGKHKGLCNYTIGQRKGLGIALGKPAFVTEINPKDNTVTLGENDDLFKKEVYSSGNVFTDSDLVLLEAGLKVKAKIRYAARPAAAVIFDAGNGMVKAIFEEAQRAATPGQSIVFYIDDIVIGGGFIEWTK